MPTIAVFINNYSATFNTVVIISVAAAKSLQSCLTLRDPINSNPPGSPIPGILQARTLEWVTISFSNAWKWKVKVKSLLATPWTAPYQAPPSMGFSRRKYWSGVPSPSPMMLAGAVKVSTILLDLCMRATFTTVVMQLQSLSDRINCIYITL